MATIPLIEHPPRPADGTGKIIDTSGGIAAELTWENGKLTKVEPVSESLGRSADLKLTGLDGGSSAPVCWKCLLDESGAIIVCWQVPC